MTTAKSGSPVYRAAPGLDRVIDGMVLDSIWSRLGLTLRERSLATISALAVGMRPGLEKEILRALDLGVAAEEIVEAFVQIMYYAGFNTGIAAMEMAQAVFEDQSVCLQVQPDERDDQDLDEEGAGRRLRIQGSAFDDAYVGAARLAPEVGQLVTRYMWGYVYGRPGLDIRTRLLVGIAALGSLGPVAEAPLRQFLPGALRNGLTRQEIAEILLQVMFYAGVPPILSTLDLAAVVLTPES